MSKIAIVFVMAALALPLHAAQLININSANQNALEILQGIGPAKALAIIEYRNTNGPFLSIEDIMKVSGIGPAIFEDIKASITVETLPMPPATKKVAPAATKSAAQTAPVAAGDVLPPEGKTQSALWLSLSALAVLLASGAAGAWYLQASAAKKEETTLTVDGFDIE